MKNIKNDDNKKEENKPPKLSANQVAEPPPIPSLSEVREYFKLAGFEVKEGKGPSKIVKMYNVLCAGVDTGVIIIKQPMGSGREQVLISVPIVIPHIRRNLVVDGPMYVEKGEAIRIGPYMMNNFSASVPKEKKKSNIEVVQTLPTKK